MIETTKEKDEPHAHPCDDVVTCRPQGTRHQTAGTATHNVEIFATHRIAERVAAARAVTLSYAPRPRRSGRHKLKL
jgi:hypothetical protein